MWGLLADDDRLRVFAALALGATTPEQVALATGLSVRVVLAALAKLEAGDAVKVVDQAWSVDKGSLRRHAEESAHVEPLDGVAPHTAAVLRAFLRDGRLVSLPSTRSKMLVVLDHVAAVFEPGVRYPEREVDALLRVFHDDHAALRRYLVDEGFLAREAGEYWRSGGTVL